MVTANSIATIVNRVRVRVASDVLTAVATISLPHVFSCDPAAYRLAAVEWLRRATKCVLSPLCAAGRGGSRRQCRPTRDRPLSGSAPSLLPPSGEVRERLRIGRRIEPDDRAALHHLVG